MEASRQEGVVVAAEEVSLLEGVVDSGAEVSCFGLYQLYLYLLYIISSPFPGFRGGSR